MAIVLYRVDERLIHGQVVVGWGNLLRPQRYVVVDDALAQSEWEQELFVLGVPEKAETEFVSVQTAREKLRAWEDSEARTILLTRDIPTMLALAGDGLLREKEVNLGGLHFQEGREEVLPYLFLSDSDRDTLRELAEEGAKVSARNLPGTPKVALDSLLG